jgi:hypothetical protein
MYIIAEQYLIIELILISFLMDWFWQPKSFHLFTNYLIIIFLKVYIIKLQLVFLNTTLI